MGVGGLTIMASACFQICYEYYVSERQSQAPIALLFLPVVVFLCLVFFCLLPPSEVKTLGDSPGDRKSVVPHIHQSRSAAPKPH